MRNDQEAISQRFDSLPQHLWEEIMAWLPPRSLLRCMSVSKSWRAHIASLLDDPSFVANHLRNAASRRRSLLFCLLRPPPYELSVATYYGQRGAKYVRAGFGLRASSCSVVRGTASHRDGIVLMESCDGRAVLCNPAMNEWKSLTVPLSESRYMVLGWGLGYDGKAGDYKIVRFDRDLYTNLLANVYSLSGGSWRVLKTTSLEFYSRPMPLHEPVIFSKGRCYFMVSCCASPEYKVIYFDMSQEEFGVVPLPGLRGGDVATLVAWKGGLAIISCPYSMTSLNPIPIEIWAAEEEGGESCAITWTKKHCIDSKMFLEAVCPNGFRFWTDDELVGQDFNGRLILYNLRSGEVGCLNIPGEEEFSLNSWAIPYLESLVSVQPGKEN